MAEIMQLPYEDPDGIPLFGSEEILTLGNRSAFDDVDDYHGWSEAPPTAKDGALLAGDEGWERSVSVGYVNPDDLNSTSLTDTGVKRITVKPFMDVATMIEERLVQCCVHVATRDAGGAHQCAPFCAVQAWPALAAQRLPGPRALPVVQAGAP